MEKNFRAELTGVFGDPVDGNPTGYMEEAAYQAEGLNFRYLTIYVKREDLKAAVEGAKAMNMKGFNLTMPHKIDVIPMLDELTEAAEIIGAVNTVVNKNGRLCGDNTDGRGFVQALKNAGYKTLDKDITILGAGGAAKAIAVECALSGAKSITVINRSVDKGEALAALINEKTKADARFIPWTSKVKIPESTQILIQATNIGLFPDVDDLPDIDYDSVPKGIIVSDVVFNPAVSAFLNKVQTGGAITISGLGMLACQGALNYTIWTGRKAPLELMEKALVEVM